MTDTGNPDIGQSDRGQPDRGQPDRGQPDATPSPEPRPAASGATASDATAEDETRAGATTGRAHRRRASALIGVLTLLLGFAIAIQLHSTSSGDALAGARPDDLISILDDQNSEATRLRSRIAELQGTLQRLRDAGTNGPAARQEAQDQADGLGILTGTVPATGPGVIVTITDPKNALHAEDLLDVVEELRGAGAEAIQFGPVRIGMTSAFSDVNGHVSLDGVALVAPYVVRAIGPGATMQTALDIPGGVAAVVRTAGGTAAITTRTTIDITVVRTVPTNKYAHPVSR